MQEDIGILQEYLASEEYLATKSFCKRTLGVLQRDDRGSTIGHYIRSSARIFWMNTELLLRKKLKNGSQVVK